MVRYTHTTICSLARDHLNFAQVEALNIDGFENDSRLFLASYTTLYYHEAVEHQETSRILSTSRTFMNRQPNNLQERYARIRFVYQS